ncbi:MAG: hypothetical protein JHD35_03645 [Sphingopyxis sp.]|nr:hypothetical protein [Sphingopyxis sp.]
MIRTALYAVLCSMLATTAAAQPMDAGREASQFVPISNEPAAELFVDPPLAGPLTRGAVIIPYRTNHFRILPVFGASAVDVSPRAGHLHVSVDDLPWRWADAGDNGAVVVNGLPAGPHKILIELATPEHKILTGRSVSFIVPNLADVTADGPSHNH